MNSLSSPLVRWHIRHVIVLWIGTRILVTMALAWTASMGERTRVPASDADGSAGAAFVAFVITLPLLVIDRRRIGAPLLFANLGYTWRWQLATAAAICIIAELLVTLGFKLLLTVSG